MVEHSQVAIAAVLIIADAVGLFLAYLLIVDHTGERARAATAVPFYAMALALLWIGEQFASVALRLEGVDVSETRP